MTAVYLTGDYDKTLEIHQSFMQIVDE